MTVSTDAGQPPARPTAGAVGSLAATHWKDPWDFYAELKGTGDIVWDEEMEAWLVSSFDLVKQVTRDDQVVWQTPNVYEPSRPIWGMTYEEYVAFNGPGERGAIGIHEGETYDRMHRWWFRVLSPKVLSRWGDTLIEPIANAQIDRFIDSGRVELADGFCDAVTSRVMIAVLGLPWREPGWLERYLELLRHGQLALFKYGEGMTPPREVIDAALSAAGEMQEMVLPHVIEKRAGGDADFISMIWRDAEEIFGDGGYDERDVLSTVMIAFGAGSSSVGAAAAAGFHLLLTQPELQEPVFRGGEAAARAFAEEAMRLYGPVEWRPRFAKCDTELGGVPIKKGEMVITATGAAHRDARRYSCPLEVKLDRTRPRDHYAFYQGPRICPGQSLARYELARLFTVALKRLSDLRPDPEAQAPRFSGAMVRRWEPLNALFTPRVAD